MKKIFGLAVAATFILVGCGNNDDLKSQIEQLQKQNLEMNAKLVEVDKRIDPLDASTVKRAEMDKAVAQLQAAIESLKTQITFLNQEREAQADHITGLEVTLSGILEYVATLPTNADVDAKIEQAIQVLLTDVITVIHLNQVELSIRLDKLEADNKITKEEMLAVFDAILQLNNRQDAAEAAISDELQALRNRVFQLEVTQVESIQAEVAAKLAEVKEKLKAHVDEEIAKVKASIATLPDAVYNKIKDKLPKRFRR